MRKRVQSWTKGERRLAATRLVTLAVLACLLVVVTTGAQSAGNEELYLTILHTNDEHSALLPHSPAVDYHPDLDDPSVGGFARLATTIQEIRENKAQQGEPVLLLNAGDFLGGSAFAWLAPRGHPVELSLLQAMGYDAVTIGNHEYDYGPDVLARYLREAGYPNAHESTLVLASNTVPPEEHPLANAGLLRSTGILRLENGLTVGVFGLIGNDALEVTYETGAVQFTDRLLTAREAVATLRAAGADIVVALSHSGVDEDKHLAQEVPGIDVIVGGHCHTALHEPLEINSTFIVQAGSLGRYLGQLELAYDPATGKVHVCNQENDRPFLMAIDDSLSPHPEIQRMVAGYTTLLNEHISEMTEGRFDDIMATVAQSGFTLSDQPPLRETPAGNFITDAMRLVTEEITGQRVFVAVQANGNIRGSIIPGSTQHALGAISFYDLAEVVGLGYGADGYAGYPIVSAYLTGEELYRLLYVAVALERFKGNTYFLQFSGLRYSYPRAGLSVTDAELFTGEGLQPAEGSTSFVPLRRGDTQLYHVVTDAYVYAFLPLAAELLPHLTIAPKNADGEPIPPERMHELFVCHESGRELKVWEAVVRHAANQPPGEGGIPRILDYYRATSGRINPN